MSDAKPKGSTIQAPGAPISSASELWEDKFPMEPCSNMDRDPFEVALAAAIGALPSPYRHELDSVAIVIQDEPDHAQLASVGARGLFGLYQGVPRTAYGADGAPVPSKITLFRGPLMRAYQSPDALMQGVQETLDHEVAHHLGISDGRLKELRTGKLGTSDPS